MPRDGKGSGNPGRSWFLLAVFASTILAAATTPPPVRQEDPARVRKLLIKARDLVRESSDEDRRILGRALVEYYLQHRDPENALELAVHLNIPEGFVFQRIAMHYAQSGDLQRAIAIASSPSTGQFRAQALSGLAQQVRQQLGIAAVRQVVAAIEDSAARASALLQVGSFAYPPDSTTRSLLRELMAEARSDTTHQALERFGQLAVALMAQGDWTGLRELEQVPLPVERKLPHYMNALSQLRGRQDRRFDSLAAVTWKMITEVMDMRVRHRMMQQYDGYQIPGRAASNWEAVADGISDMLTRRSYVTRLARGPSYNWDLAMAGRVGEYLLVRGDTAGARDLFADAAISEANQYQWSGTRSPAGLSAMLRRAIELSPEPGAPGRDWRREQCEIQLVKTDAAYARRLANDTAFASLKPQLQEAAVSTIMHADLQSGIALAMLMSDSARSDEMIREGAERLTSAGMLNAAMGVAEHIRSPHVQARSFLRIAERRLQAGDTTGVRALVLRSMKGMDVRADFHGTLTTFATVALRSDMVDGVLEWADQLTPDRAAFVIVSLATKMRE